MTGNKNELQISNSQRGFSLIELAIVLAIFLVIVGTMINVFVSMVSGQKKISAEQQFLHQAGFVMESLSGGLRAAAKDPDGSCLGKAGAVYALTHCPDNGQACSGVEFINPLDNNACTEVYLDTSQNPQSPLLVLVKNGGAPQNLLSPALRISYARFIIDGDKNLRVAFEGGAVWPKITMALGASPGPGQPEKIIQTTISKTNANQ